MDKSQLAKQIGRRIAEAREQAGLSRDEVGKQLGLSERGYGHIEAGRSLITLDHLIQLPRILGKPVTYFLPIHILTEAELNDLTHDPLLQQFIAAWPDLDLDQRRAFVHLAKKGKILKAKRERGEA